MASCSYSHVVPTSIFSRAMVPPEIVLNCVPGEADTHHLRIRARAYSLSLGDDPLFLQVDDAAGRRWADLFVGAAVDRRDGRDSTTRIGKATIMQVAQGSRITFPLSSSAWSAKRLVIDCFEDAFQASVEVEGSGYVNECRLFGSHYSGDPGRGAGFYRSAHHFRSLFNPEPSELERRCTAADVPAAGDVVGTSLPGLRHWVFTPARFCFGPSLNPPPTELTSIPDGPWLTIGLAVAPGEHHFT